MTRRTKILHIASANFHIIMNRSYRNFSSTNQCQPRYQLNGYDAMYIFVAFPPRNLTHGSVASKQAQPKRFANLR